MRRLMAMVADRRMDLTPLITHRFALDDIKAAYDLFSRQGDGVLKVGLFPAAVPDRTPAEIRTEVLTHMGL
jgi:threonine dehydrogenase-like Zn-dependent dehydrogenase